jgi:hypothetical protein
MADTDAGSTNIPLAVFATRMRFSLAAFHMACLDTPTSSAACPADSHFSNSWIVGMVYLLSLWFRCHLLKSRMNKPNWLSDA